MKSHTDPADLPDLNVWLALAATDHPHHRQALHYWEQQASPEVLFCTVTALGLIRFVSQPKLMGAAVLASADANLAALAIANGWRLVSFERDFERFQGLHWLPL